MRQLKLAMTTEHALEKLAEEFVDEHNSLSRLCSLLEKSLKRRFTKLELTYLTKENERKLLISLSQIHNLIRRWTDEQQLSRNKRGSRSNTDSQCADHAYLNKIVGNLGLLVNAKSQYVRHAVGNVFLAISEFLLDNERRWDIFIHYLCVCFEFSMCKIHGHSPEFLINEAEKSFVSNLILVLSSSTWNGTTEITRILRGIIKFLKGKDDAELVGILLKSLGTCLTKVPWYLLEKLHDGSNTEVGGSSEEAEAKILFLGNFVQLACSAIALIGFAEEPASHYESAILHEVCELVPRLLDCCISEDQRQILPYFQHKILMLMIKLSFHMQLGCSILVLWLQLLQRYYQDLIPAPISLLECGQDDSLEGSPFLLVLDNKEICHMSSSHVQRKAVFLFLRCSLSLIGLSNRTAGFKCTCMRLSSFPDPDLNTVQDCFAGKMGLLDLYGWLQGHVPSIMFSESKVDLDKCIKFASSFVRCFVQEDGLLFEVLLLLLTIPAWAERLFSKHGRAGHGIEEDVLFHVSNLFNPLLLFHVFLAELQYDHQVLLDYLISKDVGGKCAEYLLRCLRIVCDSWILFVEYTVWESVVCQSSCQSQRNYKRRRASHSDFSEKQKRIPLRSELALSSNQHKEEHKLRSKYFGIRCLQLESAKECLLSLKSALRKLHRRKLFPYNPEVLIKRLTRFEELCYQLF